MFLVLTCAYYLIRVAQYNRLLTLNDTTIVHGNRRKPVSFRDRLLVLKPYFNTNSGDPKRELCMVLCMVL